MPVNWKHIVTLAYEESFAKTQPVLYQTLLQNRLIQVQVFLKETSSTCEAHLRAHRNFYASLFDQFDLFGPGWKIPVEAE